MSQGGAHHHLNTERPRSHKSTTTSTDEESEEKKEKPPAPAIQTKKDLDQALQRTKEAEQLQVEEANMVHKQVATEERVLDNLDRADHSIKVGDDQVHQIDSGCYGFWRCIFPCCTCECCRPNKSGHDHEMQFVKDSGPPAVVFSPDAQPSKKKKDKDKKLSPQAQERKAEINELAQRVHNMHLAADQERKDLATEDTVLPAVETGVKKASEDAKKVTKDTKSALKNAKK